MTTQDDIPPIPDFDPGRTKRAVWRGVLRTAVTATAILLVGVLLLDLGAQWIQRRGDREDRMVDVLETALRVANPGYYTAAGSCCDTTAFSLSFTVRLAPLRAGDDASNYFSGGAVFTVSQNQFGRVEWPPPGFVKETPLFTALDSVGTDAPPSKADTKTILDRLPESMHALAVVDLAKPLGESEFSAFVQRHAAVPPETAIYDGRIGGTPISWRLATSLPDATQGDAPELAPGELPRNGLAGFRRWVGDLRDHDAVNLDKFGLDLKLLRKSAADGLAYAYITQRARVSDLRALIDDPQVRAIRVADVAYDLTGLN
ncbi:hypothetical protein Misp01_81060 [Microtetraspora sp. NBRC 13810]|uniref:hypothetical protein n=1 Tax=Microtetraspora sp. NBRC 13810 TaxID=3030990 RepID=UPI0024A2E84B|nr:hypothetical protein [Microtetraspora sp. NBRC 13810]GLW12978.1 hypothetical protein Misp01_81060 [Microtetraspora sp. NBRC 13810]